MSENKEIDFSLRLKAARELRHLSQVDLAEKAGLPPSSISHFESGSRKPSFDNLRKLAGVLNVTTDYLLARTNNPSGSLQTDPLYRDAQNLSDKDRELATDFIRMLANRSKQGD